MKISTLVSVVLLHKTADAFAPIPSTSKSRVESAIVVKGYLDGLGQQPPQQPPPPVDPNDPDADSKENTDLSKDRIDRFGPGDWNTYSDFGDEFDGGDGQMGVAGDGGTGLQNFQSAHLSTSRSMSAKNAWGKSTGYAETLMSEGVERQRAQQIENWRNQQEVRQRQIAQRQLTEEFDKVSHDEDWRTLSKFGVERNQEFNMDETFGDVRAADQLEGIIRLSAGMMQAQIFELSLKNEYMGFADFRAAFTADSSGDFTVSPSEGSLSRDPTNFVVKFRPQRPGLQEGYLVIETEDFKKTWKVEGSTAY